MKKWSLVAVCCLLMMALAIPAGAEMITITPTFHDPANDIADWHLDRRDISDELIQELRGGSFWGNLLPISDDLFVWYGTFQYHNLVQEESFWLSYDVEMPRSDAYAVATDGDGKRLWSLRLSDPQSVNSFTEARLLDDDRILLKFPDNIGEFGTQYYIVSQEGEVQEMLPSYKAKEYGVKDMLIPMHGGYFAGGYYFDQDAYATMFGPTNFTFFDEDLNMLWRYESDDYMASSMEVTEASDGFLLGGSIWPNYIPDQPMLFQAGQQVPVALKLDLEGNLVWTYIGHELSEGGASILYDTGDGGAMFLTSYDPTVPTAYEDAVKPTLVKLDNKGQVEWVKRIEGLDLYNTGELVPFGEGYLVSGYTTENDVMQNYVLYLSKDLELIETAIVDAGESDALLFSVYCSLVPGYDGKVFLQGMTVESEDYYAGMDNPQTFKPFYADIGKVFGLK